MTAWHSGRSWAGTAIEDTYIVAELKEVPGAK